MNIKLLGQKIQVTEPMYVISVNGNKRVVCAKNIVFDRDEVLAGNIEILVRVDPNMDQHTINNVLEEIALDE